jgi:hypothetical protein
MRPIGAAAIPLALSDTVIRVISISLTRFSPFIGVGRFVPGRPRLVPRDFDAVLHSLLDVPARDFGFGTGRSGLLARSEADHYAF